MAAARQVAVFDDLIMTLIEVKKGDLMEKMKLPPASFRGPSAKTIVRFSQAVLPRALPRMFSRRRCFSGTSAKGISSPSKRRVGAGLRRLKPRTVTR